MIRIGHKGAAALAPENTLRSIERAIEAGVDMVEIDVLTLNDGTLVLAHSNDLLEVSHGAARGTVTSQSLAELRRVAPELPTLDEALALLARHGAGIFLDLKWHGWRAPTPPWPPSITSSSPRRPSGVATRAAPPSTRGRWTIRASTGDWPPSASTVSSRTIPGFLPLTSSA